jgi:hypothetical protein
MGSIHHVAGAALLIMMVPASGQAQSRGITYDCDTGADNFSELILPAPAGPFVVTGQVKLRRIAKSKYYVPLTRLTISEVGPVPGQSPESLAGFKLSAMPAKALKLEKKFDKPVLEFLEWDEMAGGRAISHEMAGPLDYADGLPFTLRYDGSSVVGQIDGRELKMAFPAQNPVVRIICSTGEYLYTDLKIEKAG